MLKRRARAIHRAAIAILVLLVALTVWLLVQHVQQFGSWRPEQDARQLAYATLAGTGAVLTLSMTLLRPERANRRRLQWLSTIWTLTFVSGLCLLLWLAWISSDLTEIPGEIVTNDAETAAYLAAHPLAGDGPVYEIPTGVFLQAFDFTSGSDVAVSGYVWQRYDKSIPATIERGVIFPEASDSYDFQEAYRYMEGDIEVIGWYFNLGFRQAFDYTRYPMDRQDIWIRIWSPSAEAGAVPVPDFASYPAMAPSDLNGIDEQAVYGAWDPAATAFSFVQHRYNTTFGSNSAVFRSAVPELYFNLALKRDFLQPLITHLPFTLAIAGLLFGTMLLGTNDPDLRNRFGLATLGVIAANGALLFTVILEHNNIRERVASQQIAYIETIPFTLYFMILLTTINAIALDAPDTPWFFDYNNNIWPLMLFWPMFSSILFVATFFVFF